MKPAWKLRWWCKASRNSECQKEAAVVALLIRIASAEACKHPAQLQYDACSKTRIVYRKEGKDGCYFLVLQENKD
jgi:hypothetical protein